MSDYTHVFFDLDHTLWDFEKNSSETLAQLFEDHKLHQYELFDFVTFEKVYSETNRSFWDLYNRGEIGKQELREKRFSTCFAKLGLAEEFQPSNIGDQYLQICPDKSALFPGAIEMLDYLSEKYRLSIITNGFPESQFRKMNSSSITKYFDHVIISESVGYAKPHKGIFDHAMNCCAIKPGAAIMIGDNLETDVQGAINAGLHAVWFNDEKKLLKHSATYEINQLAELTRFL